MARRLGEVRAVVHSREHVKAFLFIFFVWVSIVLLGSSAAERSRGYFPAHATLNPQSTPHGVRPGPKLGP